MRNCLLLILRHLPPYRLWKLFGVPPRKVTVPPGFEDAFGRMSKPVQTTTMAEVRLGNRYILEACFDTNDHEYLVNLTVWHQYDFKLQKGSLWNQPLKSQTWWKGCVPLQGPPKHLLTT